VETDPLAPKLFVWLCSESSLLPPPGVNPAPGICNGGPLRLVCIFSDGVRCEPIGVAIVSLGGPALLGMLRGGSAEPPASDIGGAATLFTGLWLGEAGMDRPNRGTLLPDCDRLPAPGMGGRSSGAGDAMSMRFGGLLATR